MSSQVGRANYSRTICAAENLFAIPPALSMASPPPPPPVVQEISPLFGETRIDQRPSYFPGSPHGYMHSAPMDSHETAFASSPLSLSSATGTGTVNIAYSYIPSLGDFSAGWVAPFSTPQPGLPVSSPIPSPGFARVSPISSSPRADHVRVRSNSNRTSMRGSTHTRQRTWSVTLDEVPGGGIKATGLVADDGTFIAHGTSFAAIKLIEGRSGSAHSSSSGNWSWLE